MTFGAKFWVSWVSRVVLAATLLVAQFLVVGPLMVTAANEPNSGNVYGVNDSSAVAPDGYLTMNPGFSADGDFTVESWVKSPDLSQANAVVLIGADPSGANYRALTVHSVSTTQWSVDISGLDRLYFTTKNAVALKNDTWFYVAVVGDANGIAMWIDGEKMTTPGCVVSNANCELLASGNYRFKYSVSGVNYTTFKDASRTIGAWKANVRQSRGASMNEVRFTNAAVYASTDETVPRPNAPLTSLAETKLLLTSASIDSLSDSTGTQALTKVGSINLPEGSIEFNSNQGLSYSGGVGANMGTSDFTWEAWVYQTKIGSTYSAIFDSRTTANDVAGMALFAQPISGDPDHSRLTLASPQERNLETVGLLSKNVWQHVAVVRESGKVRIYVDGASIGVGAFSSNLTNTSFHLGKNRNNVDFFNGRISNARFVKGVAVYTSPSFATTGALDLGRSAFQPLTAIAGTTVLIRTLFDPTGTSWRGISAASGTTAPNSAPTVTGTPTSSAFHPDVAVSPSINLALANNVTSTPYATTIRITAQVSTAGSVTFLSGDSVIDGCSSIASVALSATCDWTPDSADSAVRLTANFVPIDRVTYSSLSGSGGLTIDVAKVAAIVLASSPSVISGDPVPLITSSVSGLVNGDTPAVITGLACRTSYTTSSAAGSLPSTSCSGGSASNYELTYTPGAVVVLENFYRVDFDAGLGAVSPAFAEPQIGTATVLPTPTRQNYSFDGWYSSALGGTLIGQGGSRYVPVVDVVLYAHWTQSSLVGLSNPVAFGSITAFPGNDGGITATRSETKIIVDYFADSLPEGTVITAYLQGDKTHAVNVIGGNPNILLSVVVAWKAVDETVPDIDPDDSPIRVTIINGNIKSGAIIYAIKDGVPTVVGTATMDGRATANIFQDPEIAIVNASVETLTGSVEFDAQSLLSYPSSDDFSLTGDYTIEFWAKYALRPKSGAVLISRWNNENKEYSLETSGGYLHWLQQTTSGVDKLEFYLPTANVWHHYAIVRSGNALTAYVDGISDGVATFGESAPTAQPPILEIGGRSLANSGEYSTFFQGRMSNVRISKEAVYVGPFTPSSGALKAVATTKLLLNTPSGASFAVDSALSATPTLSGTPLSSTDVPFVVSVPEPPSQVRGTSWVGTTSAINWNASARVNGQSENTYTVYGSNDGTNYSPVAGCVEVAGTNCTGTGFVMARGYVFKAKAINDAGSSDYSIVEIGDAVMDANPISYCAEVNVYGSQACGVMGSRQPFTTAIMPTPLYCNVLDGNELRWQEDNRGFVADHLGVFDADGNMYFVHRNEIRKMTPADFASSPSCSSRLFNDSPLLKSPSGTSIGMDATGNIYVSNADSVDKSVIQISADGLTARVYLTTAQTGTTLESIKFDSDQNLLGFNNPETSLANLIRFSNTSPPVKKVLLALSNPTFGELGGNKFITGFSLNAFDDLLISLNANGDDYLVKLDAEFDQGTQPSPCANNCSSSYYEQLAQWEVYDASGTFYPNHFPSTFHVFAKFSAYTWSDAPTVDSEGNVWVAQKLSQRLLKLSPEGKPLLSTTTPFGLDGPTIFTDRMRIDPNGTVWVQFGNGGTAWAKYVGATKPFLRQLTFKGIGSTPYGTAKIGAIQVDGAIGSVAFKTTNSGDISVSSIGALSTADNLEPGRYVVSGTALDSSNTAGTWTYALTVTKAQPTITLTSSLNPSVYRNSVTYTATPSAFDSGTKIFFYDATTLLGSCTVTVVSCTYTDSSMGSGLHSITAEVSESTHYLSASSEAVNQSIGTMGSTTSWTASAVPTVGQAITLTANVLPAVATGTIEFRDSNSNVLCTTGNLINGSANCEWSGNPTLGLYSVTAFYAGDANYSKSESSASNVNITAVYTVTYSGASGISPVVYRTGSPSYVLPTPSIPRKIFLGWFDSAVAGDLISQGGMQYTPTATITLHAQWLDSYAVTYDLALGTSVVPLQDEVGVGRSFIVAAAPTRPSHLFNGWSSSPDNLLQLPGSPFTMGASDVTLTANWLSLVHPITRTTFNNGPGTSWLWSYAGGGVHAGVDIQPGWCVTSGTDAAPADWIITEVTSDAGSNSFKVGGGYTFSGGGYTFSPDPMISISTGATQVIALGSPITRTAISNTACTANKFVVSPELPAGLMLDPNTGSISGQPLAASPLANYKVTAQRIVNNDGTLNVAGTMIGYSSTTFALNVIGPPTAPANVEIIPGDRQLSVAFTAGSDSGTAITKYQYSTDGGSTWNDQATTVSPFVISTTSATNAALVNGTSYDVQVRAFNAYPGVASGTVVGIPDVAPTGPTDVVVTSGNKQLSIAFTAAATTGSPIVKYQYSTDNGQSWVDTAANTSPVVITTISGIAGSTLVNETNYRVRLRAVNTLAGSGSTAVDAAPVKSAQVSLSWDLSSTSVPYLGLLTLAVAGGSGAGEVVYSASQLSTCWVSGNVLTLGGAGSLCEVTATKATDDTYLVASSVPQVISVAKIDQTSPLSLVNASMMEFGETLSLLAIGGSGDGAISYSVVDAGSTGCSISGDALSVAASGTCEISASRAQSTNFNETLIGSRPTMTVVASKSSQSLEFTSSVPITPIAGGTYEVSAQSNRGLIVDLSISSGTCSIAGSMITFGASGSCVVRASQDGNNRYSAAQRIVQNIVVGSRNQTIEFNDETRAIITKTYGDATFSIVATSSEPTANIDYSLGSQTTNSSCSVTSNGLVVVRNVGTCEIVADSPSTSSFAAASPISHVIEIDPAVPFAPYILSTSAGNRSITVTFSPPANTGGASVSGYQLVAEDQNSGSTSIVVETGCSATLESNQGICTVRGLDNGVNYRVKLAAINRVGVGEFSILSNELTAATNPAAVQQLSIIEDDGSFSINWQDPDSLGGGVFTEYRIFVTRSDNASFDPLRYFVVSNAATHSLLITQEFPADNNGYSGGPLLENGVAYDVKVVTVTVANALELAGNTAVANKIPRTVPGAPRSPSIKLLREGLVISWSAPGSDGGRPITSYRVVFGGSACMSQLVTDTFCIVSVPETPGEYVYEIVAVNGVGGGKSSRGIYTVDALPAPLPATTIPPPAGQEIVDQLPATGSRSWPLNTGLVLVLAGLAVVSIVRRLNSKQSKSRLG